MATREIPTPPDWLVPGADVLCFDRRDIRGRTINPVATTVTKMTNHYFDVAAEKEPRFPIDRCAVRQGGDFGWTRYVIPLDSEEASKLLAAEDARRRQDRAAEVVDEWRRRKSRATRLDAIAALQAIEND